MQGKAITGGRDYARAAAEVLGRRFNGRRPLTSGKARRRKGSGGAAPVARRAAKKA
jgi:hypothetical protein